MGNCCNKKLSGEGLLKLEYPKYMTLKITRKNYLGKPVGISKVTFENTTPIKEQCLECSLGIKNAKVFGCILPGLDPRDEIDKECQDNYTFMYNNNGLLCALYDGHGKEGLKVSNFCVEFTEKFFKKYSKDFETDTEATLIRLLHKCDEKLKKAKFNSEMSGSTAVLVYIISDTIHTASLGDSRSIISTLIDEAVPIPELNHNYYTKFAVKRNLKAVPLTTDQKPNHEDEYKRISEAGGIVEQVTDTFGRPIGPYRVWLPGEDHPGLAMSRSIGDNIAKRIGVIATPVCHTFQIYESDQFLVLASDGVWDVMENIEVVNFIEKFKPDCKQTPGKSDVFPCKPDNSTISRLLCEEARYRWSAIIEAEDVMVDDISCIIVDFEQISIDMKINVKERNVMAFQSLAISTPDKKISVNEEDTGITEHTQV